MPKTEKKTKTKIEIDLLDHEYVISVERDGYTLYKKGDKLDKSMGYYSAFDLMSPLKKISRDFMFHTGEVYDLSSYLEEYNRILKTIQELVKH